MSSKTAMSASSSSIKEVSAALCPHFGDCGGCSIQNLPYEAQLERKAGKVSALLAPLSVPISAVHASPDIWYYRNKMEFSFGDVYPPQPEGPSLYLGLKPKGRWDKVLDISECRLLSPQTPALLSAVRRWARKESIPPYNSHRHSGFLRHLVVRESKNGPQRMVVLVTAPGNMPVSAYIKEVSRAYPATTLLWGINGKLSDTAISDSMTVLTGPGTIVETMSFPGQEVKFQISPLSFFQTNTRGAEKLYEILREWIKEIHPEKVLDLYCGGGGISLSMAAACGKVWGIEVNPSAVEDAKKNAVLNGISNVEFYSGSVDLLLPPLLALAPEAVIVDPPRAGLGARVLEMLSAQGPRTLLYVSCNPEALARDLAIFKSHYKAERAEIVDLFPHTDHVETVVLLKAVGGQNDNTMSYGGSR